MSSYIQYETILFLRSIGLGVFLALLYEMICAFRNVVKHYTMMTAIEDMIYWSGVGGAVFISAYMGNQGIIRSFLLLGIGLGALLCYLTICPLFFRLWVNVFRIPVFVVKKIIKWLLFMGERGKILMYKIAVPALGWKNGRVLQAKRSKQVEKVKKKE